MYLVSSNISMSMLESNYTGKVNSTQKYYNLQNQLNARVSRLFNNNTAAIQIHS